MNGNNDKDTRKPDDSISNDPIQLLEQFRANRANQANQANRANRANQANQANGGLQKPKIEVKKSATPSKTSKNYTLNKRLIMIVIALIIAVGLVITYAYVQSGTNSSNVDPSVDSLSTDNETDSGDSSDDDVNNQSTTDTPKEQELIEPVIWMEYEMYDVGARVVYDQKIYEAEWWNKGIAPDTPVKKSNPWKLSADQVIPEKNITAPAWEADKEYEDGGIQVAYKGLIYESKWWTKGIAPDTPVENSWDTPWKVIWLQSEDAILPEATDDVNNKPASSTTDIPKEQPTETAKPAETTKPTETAKKPTETAKKPTETTKKPTETTKKPTETTKKPAETTNPNDPIIWMAYGMYDVGTKVIYKGKIYEARWWNQNFAPDKPVENSWDLPWKLSNNQAIPKKAKIQASAWDTEVVYDTGDRVAHKGLIYEAKWYTQGFAPDKSVKNEWDTPWKVIWFV